MRRPYFWRSPSGTRGSLATGCLGSLSHFALGGPQSPLRLLGLPSSHPAKSPSCTREAGSSSAWWLVPRGGQWAGAGGGRWGQVAMQPLPLLHPHRNPLQILRDRPIAALTCRQPSSSYEISISGWNTDSLFLGRTVSGRGPKSSLAKDACLWLCVRFLRVSVAKFPGRQWAYADDLFTQIIPRHFIV